MNPNLPSISLTDAQLTALNQLSPSGGLTISGAIGNPYNGLSPSGWLSDQNIGYDSTLQTIRGELLTVQMSIGSSLLEDNLIDKDKIKHELALELAHKLLSGKYIEFTQRTDFATDNKLITARLFVTPDSQTQVIRKVQEKS